MWLSDVRGPVWAASPNPRPAVPVVQACDVGSENGEDTVGRSLNPTICPDPSRPSMLVESVLNFPYVMVPHAKVAPLLEEVVEGKASWE